MTQLIDVLHRYFAAEKNESLLFLLVGVFATGIAIALWLRQSPYKAAAWPLIIIAAIQIVVGSTVFLRTGAQVRLLERKFADQVAVARGAEIARMQRVMKSFLLYRWIEIILAVAGMAMIFLGRNVAMQSAGVALSIQSLLMLALDYFAERRGAGYLDALHQL